jgi:hypothetical protein
MAVYAQYQTVRLAGTFDGADGLSTEPTSTELKVRRPDGVVLTYNYMDGGLERSGDGTFEAIISASLPGRWLYQFTGTGSQGSAPAGASWFDVVPGIS